jgi:hypothetical protein
MLVGGRVAVLLALEPLEELSALVPSSYQSWPASAPSVWQQDDEIFELDTCEMEAMGTSWIVAASSERGFEHEAASELADSLAAEAEGIQYSLQRLRSSERRIDYMKVVCDQYSAYLDDLVDFTKFEQRTYDLASATAGALVEVRLKWERERRNVEEIEDELTSYEGTPLPESCRNAIHRIGDIARVHNSSATVLDSAQSVAASLAEEADKQRQNALNNVLYWLSIITFSFGILALIDKYGSADTFGLAAGESLHRSLLLVLPLLVLFFFAAVRHGIIARGLRSFLLSSKLRITDRFLFRGSYWLADIPVVGSVYDVLTRPLRSLQWRDWTSWKVTTLIHGPVRQLSKQATRGLASKSELQALEKNINEEFGLLWDEIQVAFEEEPIISIRQDRISRGYKRLRRDLHRDLALDRLILDLPGYFPTMAIHACLLTSARAQVWKDRQLRVAWRDYGLIAHRFALADWLQEHSFHTTHQTLVAVEEEFEICLAELLLDVCGGVPADEGRLANRQDGSEPFSWEDALNYSQKLIVGEWVPESIYEGIIGAWFHDYAHHFSTLQVGAIDSLLSDAKAVVDAD